MNAAITTHEAVADAVLAQVLWSSLKFTFPRANKYNEKECGGNRRAAAEKTGVALPGSAWERELKLFMEVSSVGAGF